MTETAGDGITRPATSFDARALTDPVDRSAVRAYVRAMRSNGNVPTTNGWIAGIVMAVFAVLFFIALLSQAGPMAVLDPITLLPSVLIVIVLLAIAGLVVWHSISGGGNGTRWYRLDRFARANGMSFQPLLTAPALPGMIFGLGHDRQVTDLVVGEQPRTVQFGNYRYTTGSGRSQSTHHWGYIAIRLDVPLPNIVLDAKSNNTVFGSNLPEGFARAQRLSLEGDFDEHFALYCPTGYEQDALYLFTPDIMARFIDHAAAFDVEIVDDWMFLYTRRTVSTLDPDTWAWSFSIVGALIDKLTQWGRWRDEHLAQAQDVNAGGFAPVAPAVAGTPAVAGAPATPAHPFAAPVGMLTPPPGVAAQGRRLRHRIPLFSYVAFGVILVVWFWQFFAH
ncbi:MAG: hypothetical protein ACTHON_03265 [Humibacter sp.]